MDYLGLKCGICGEDFGEGDDVVVCPDCGTPMHRSCFRETGACPNASRHAEDFVFEGFDKIKKSAQDGSDSKRPRIRPSSTKHGDDENICRVCGTKNREGANFCDKCGTQLRNKRPVPEASNDPDYDTTDHLAALLMGDNPDIPPGEIFDKDVTARELACFVVINATYYLTAFKRIKNGAGKFNFGAAVFSGVWFLYRKLYKVGALMLSIEALLYALKVYVTRTLSLGVMEKLMESIGLTMKSVNTLTMDQYMQLSQQMQKLPMNEQFFMMLPSLLFIIQVGVMIVCGAMANKLYYKKCLNNIAEVKTIADEQSLTHAETTEVLYRVGGVNAILGGIFGFIYLFLLFM